MPLSSAPAGSGEAGAEGSGGVGVSAVPAGVATGNGSQGVLAPLPARRDRDRLTMVRAERSLLLSVP